MSGNTEFARDCSYVHILTRSFFPAVLISLAMGLAACGGGGGGGGGNVPINDGPQGSIPDQELLRSELPVTVDLALFFSDVDAGDPLTYSVTANSDSGTVATSISGSMLTLSLGAGRAGKVSITVQAEDGSLAVVSDTFKVAFPHLYGNGVGWNDYVKNDGGDRFGATDTACDAATDGPGYGACIHGGEVRDFDTGLVLACAGLTAGDALGAFQWVCDESGATTLFFSSGLAEGKYLSDLIDFATDPASPAWKANRLIVNDGAADVYASRLMRWWENPIVVDNDGMLAGDAVAGTVYVVTADPRATYIIHASRVGLVIRPGVTLTGSPIFTAETLVSATSQHFLWFEGTVDGLTSDSFGIRWTSVKFSLLRNFNAANNVLRGVELSASSNNNSLSGVNAANNGASGVLLSLSSNNSLSRVSAANNGASGVLLTASSNNSLSGVSAANNAVDGVRLSSSSNNSLSGVSAANNAFTGVRLTSGSNNNTLSGVSAANNVNQGVSLVGSNNNALSGVSAANNRDDGVLLATSSNNTLSGVSAANNGFGVGGFGVRLAFSNNNFFTGPLKVGNNASADCFVDAESTSTGGLTDDDNSSGTPDTEHDGLCLQVAPSDFGTASTGVTLAASFVGKVTTDDTANADDTNGASAVFPVDPDLFDWTNLENPFRGWGIDGSPFPNHDHRGRWTAGEGRIWDWSLALGDTGDGGAPALLNALALPTGNDAIIHVWSVSAPLDQGDCDANAPVGSVFNLIDSTCESTFLRNAAEIGGDGIGNDNVLCESGEECLYTPNLGSYQGHGPLILAASIGAGGAVENVTLLRHETNGN